MNPARAEGSADEDEIVGDEHNPCVKEDHDG